MDEKLNLNKGTEIEEALKEFELKSGINRQAKKITESLKTDEDLSLVGNEKIEEVLKEIQPNEEEIIEKIKSARILDTDENLNLKENVKIEDSLKEFETKYAAEQKQKKAVEVAEIPKGSKLVRLVMKISGGLIKEERHAEYVLLGCSVLFIGVSIYFFFIGIKGNTKKPEPVPPEILERIKQMELNRQK